LKKGWFGRAWCPHCTGTINREKDSVSA
jgi:hypothetical protein